MSKPAPTVDIQVEIRGDDDPEQVARLLDAISSFEEANSESEGAPSVQFEVQRQTAKGGWENYYNRVGGAETAFDTPPDPFHPEDSDILPGVYRCAPRIDGHLGSIVWRRETPDAQEYYRQQRDEEAAEGGDEADSEPAPELAETTARTTSLDEFEGTAPDAAADPPAVDAPLSEPETVEELWDTEAVQHNDIQTLAARHGYPGTPVGKSGDELRGFLEDELFAPDEPVADTEESAVAVAVVGEYPDQGFPPISTDPTPDPEVAPEVNPGTWRFRILDALQWADGGPLTANDLDTDFAGTEWDAPETMVSASLSRAYSDGLVDRANIGANGTEFTYTLTEGGRERVSEATKRVREVADATTYASILASKNHDDQEPAPVTVEETEPDSEGATDPSESADEAGPAGVDALFGEDDQDDGDLGGLFDGAGEQDEQREQDDGDPYDGALTRAQERLHTDTDNEQ